MNYTEQRQILQKCGNVADCIDSDKNIEFPVIT